MYHKWISTLMLVAVDLACSGHIEYADDYCEYAYPFCYSLHPPASIADADNICQNNGGFLAQVTPSNRGALYDLLKLKDVDSRVWIGPPNSQNTYEIKGGRGEENYGNNRHSSYQFICQTRVIPCNTEDIEIIHGEFEYCLLSKNISRGVQLHVTCKEGYKVIGESSIHCKDGNWSEYPQCVATCLPPKIPDKAELLHPKSEYIATENATLICLEGYFGLGSQPTTHVTVTCKDVNVWEPHDPTCLPSGHFSHRYDPYHLEVIEAAEAENVILQCMLNIVEDIPKTNVDWLWLKNQVNLSASSLFSVDTSGSLKLYFTIESEGIYSCFAKNKDNLVPGNIFYNVKLKIACPQSRNVSLVVVKEYSSALLFCSDLASYSVNVPVWYKDGNRIWHNEGITLLPNGGLFIHKAMYADRGMYTCHVSKDNVVCGGNFTTQLKVVPPVASVCGITESPKAFPWLVTLWWEEEKVPFCYGSLVNEAWVITTSSCLFGLHRKRTVDIYVKFGWDSDMKDYDHDPKSNGIIVPVQYVKVHPNYSHRLGNADVGLVKLKYRVNFTEDIRPICLTDRDIGRFYTEHSTCEKSVNLTGFVAGWGSLEGDDLTPSVEPMLWVPKDNLENATKQPIPKGIFCAKGQLTDPLYSGDTGSPFQVSWNGKVFLYGVFNWGERKSKTGEFDYFTQVTDHVRWVNSYINRKK